MEKIAYTTAFVRPFWTMGIVCSSSVIPDDKGDDVVVVVADAVTVVVVVGLKNSDRYLSLRICRELHKAPGYCFTPAVQDYWHRLEYNVGVSFLPRRCIVLDSSLVCFHFLPPGKQTSAAHVTFSRPVTPTFTARLHHYSISTKSWEQTPDQSFKEPRRKLTGFSRRLKVSLRSKPFRRGRICSGRTTQEASRLLRSSPLRWNSRMHQAGFTLNLQAAVDADGIMSNRESNWSQQGAPSQAQQPAQQQQQQQHQPQPSQQQLLASLIRAEQIRPLPHLTDIQKAQYETIVKGLRETLQKHKADTTEHQVALSKLVELSSNIRNSYKRWQMQQQQQQLANAAQAKRAGQPQPPQSKPQIQASQGQQQSPTLAGGIPPQVAQYSPR